MARSKERFAIPISIQISSLGCFNTLNGPLQLIFENPNEGGHSLGGNVSELTIILESCNCKS